MEERVDVYDASRRRTGRVRRRGEAMKPGEYGLVVCVWVCDGAGHLLLTKRAPEKKSFPNTWENSGGSAWAGESSRQAIARELYEETGIRAREEAFLLLSLTGGKRLFLTSTSSAAHRGSRTLCSSRGRPATPNGPPWMRSGRWPGPVFWLRPLLAASASRRPGWSRLVEADAP